MFFQNCAEYTGSELSSTDLSSNASEECAIEDVESQIPSGKVLVGDMVLSPEDLYREDLEQFWPNFQTTNYQGLTTKYLVTWKDGVIPLQFPSGFSESPKANLLKICQEIGTFANIKCIEKSDEYYYVKVSHEGRICYAEVGQGPGMYLNIPPACNTYGVVAHEFLHILGIKHEHQHPQRDNHIRVIEQNIKPGQEHNFIKIPGGLVKAYDRQSIMHYKSKSFHIGSEFPTLVKRSEECDKIVRQDFPSSCVFGRTSKLSSG